MMLERRIYKNWKEICEEMDWNDICGNYKKARLKDLGTMCKYHKEGQKIVIDEIYENPIEKNDNRKNNGGHSTKQNFPNYNIEREYDDDIGVYRIINYDTKEVYIGSTIDGFRMRFLRHNGGCKGMKHTYDLLHNGGVFEIISDMTGYDEISIRKAEQHFIDEYSNDDNYNIINHRDEVNYKGKRKNKKVTYKSKINNKKLYKNIKIEADKYEQAIELLIKNGLI